MDFLRKCGVVLNRFSFSVLAGLLALLVCNSAGRAQQVDLGIPNLTQNAPVWCWAAVAEQIIRWKKGGLGPSQCELVSQANGFPPSTCCFPQVNPIVQMACQRTGGLQEIQALLFAHVGSVSMIAPPAHPVDLYNTLAQGRAIILGIQSPIAASGHVVVLRGIVPGPFLGSEPLLIINDPMGWDGFSQPVPFSQLLPFWTTAIVVN